MSDKVVSLTGGPTYQPKAEPNCVRVLEDLLERAKSGDIIGVAAATLGYEGLSSYHIGGRVGGYSMLGALSMIHLELIEANRDD